MASVPLPTNAKEKRASPFEDKIYELVAESLSGDASSYQSGQMKLSLRTENVDPVFFVNRHRQEISSAAVVVGSGITLTAGAVLSGRALMLKIKPASRRNLVSEGNETSNGSMESWSKDHELPQLERKDLTASYSSRLTDAKDSGETAQLRAGSQLSLGYASAVEQVLVAASHNNSEWLPMAAQLQEEEMLLAAKVARQEETTRAQAAQMSEEVMRETTFRADATQRSTADDLERQQEHIEAAQQTEAARQQAEAALQAEAAPRQVETAQLAEAALQMEAAWQREEAKRQQAEAVAEAEAARREEAARRQAQAAQLAEAALQAEAARQREEAKRRQAEAEAEAEAAREAGDAHGGAARASGATWMDSERSDSERLGSIWTDSERLRVTRSDVRRLVNASEPPVCILRCFRFCFFTTV